MQNFIIIPVEAYEQLTRGGEKLSKIEALADYYYRLATNKKTSVRFLEKSWKWSNKTVQLFLKNVVDISETTTETTTKTTTKTTTQKNIPFSQINNNLYCSDEDKTTTETTTKTTTKTTTLKEKNEKEEKEKRRKRKNPPTPPLKEKENKKEKEEKEKKETKLQAIYINNSAYARAREEKKIFENANAVVSDEQDNQQQKHAAKNNAAKNTPPLNNAEVGREQKEKICGEKEKQETQDDEEKQPQTTNEEYKQIFLKKNSQRIDRLAKVFKKNKQEIIDRIDEIALLWDVREEWHTDYKVFTHHLLRTLYVYKPMKQQKFSEEQQKQLNDQAFKVEFMKNQKLVDDYNRLFVNEEIQEENNTYTLIKDKETGEWIKAKYNRKTDTYDRIEGG